VSARICADRGIGRHHLLWPVIHLALGGSSCGAPPLGGDEAMKKGAAVPSGAAALFKTA